MRKTLSLSLVLLACFSLFGNLVDVEGNPVTNQTQLGVIDMKSSTFGDVKASIMTTNIVQDIVTNQVIVGYTEWTYSGDVTPNTSYSITMTEPNYTFNLYSLSPYALLGSVTTNVINPTYISFAISGTGTILANRSPIMRNTNGLAMYSDVQALETKIDEMDTSYFRVVGLTNKNQSVQYVYTPPEVTSLEIQMPESGMTKDWLVYVLASTNVTLMLPPANYWCVSESVTNDIPASTPTALYFSQINDDTYSIGRQELIPITIQSQQQLLMQSIRTKMRKIKRIMR